MRDKVKTVELKPINPDTLKISKVPNSQDSFTIELPLTHFCEDGWKNLFYEKVKQTAAIMNKELNFQINWLALEAVTTPEEINDTIALVKKIVTQTNEEALRYNEEVEKEREIHRRQEKIDEEKIRKMREMLRQS